MIYQIVVSGLTLGAIYALIAIGFTIVFSTMKLINFAHGEFVMAGGLVYGFLHFAVGMPVLAAAGLSLALCCLFGWLVYVLGVKGVDSSNHIAQVMITLGLGITAKGIAQVVIGKNTVFPPALPGLPPLAMGGITIAPQSLWIVIALVLFMAALYLVLKYTWLGLSMRAVAINGYAAVLMGISPIRTSAAAFVVAGLLGGAAGILLAPLASASYDNGIFLGIKGFAAAILGGIGNPVGAVIGGLVLGLAEAVAAGYISSIYKDAITLSLLLVILLLRPQGLIGEKLPQKL